MKNLKAVLFDVDGVLLDSTAANAAFYRELFRRIGGNAPSDEEMAIHNHMSVEAMIRRYYQDMPDSDVHDWMAKADNIEEGFDLLRPVSGAVETVTALAAQYKLGLVTNRMLGGIEELWEVVPALRSHFSAIASYEKTTNHKPHPDPVHYALKELEVRPNEAVFIGDAQTDLQAGQAAGVDVIIFGSRTWPDAVATVRDFLEIPAAINQILRG